MLFKATQIVEAIQALGYGKDLNTGLNRWLAGMTGQTGATNTLWFNYLRGLGYTGSLPTMMAAYYEASHGAAITSPVPSLFRNSEKGVWYDPSDLTSMYQDSAGTTAAVVGQPVGLVLDKSQGLVLGSELVTNGDFSSATGWTLNGVSIAGGKLVASAAANGSDARQTGKLTANKFYQVTYTVDSISGGGVRFFNAVSTGLNRTTAGTYTEIFTGTGTSLGLQFTTNGVSAVIDNLTVKELPGYHATQSTSTARPILGRHPIGGRRNLLTYTEDFSNAAWQRSLTTVTSGGELAPDGSMTADLTTSASGVEGYIRYTGSGQAVSTAHTLSIYVKKGVGTDWFRLRNLASQKSAWFNLATGAVGSVDVGATATITAAENGYYRCSLTSTNGASISLNYVDFSGADGDGLTSVTLGQTCYRWGAQLELGSTPSAYQKVVSTYDVTEAGVSDAYFLQFDGVDDFLVTPSIDFSGTDKMSVFAGVRKLSDAAAGIILELSANAATTANTFAMSAPATVAANFGLGCRGAAENYYLPATFAAPFSAVFSGLIDGSAASLATQLIPRINGVVEQDGAGGVVQAIAGFANAPIYIGMRGGTTRPFNGHLYSLIVRGALSDAAQITSAEAFVNSKTGAY